MFHPAALLLAWTLAVVALQVLDISPAFLAFILLGAVGSSPDLLRRLIWRSRWLFVSIMLLFFWMTPGLRFPGLLGRLGVTEDGMRLAAAHALHLLSLLVWVALLMTRIRAPAIVSGLHTLFKPLALIPRLPTRLALRLMLTLHYAGGAQMTQGQSRNAPSRVELVDPRWTACDGLLLFTLAVLAISALFLR